MTSTTPTSAPRAGVLSFGLAVGLVLLLALAARLAQLESAFQFGVLMGPDGDSLYHFRRMQLTAAQFPRVPTFEPLVDWPFGGPICWAPLLDFLGGALLLLPTGGALLLHGLCLAFGLVVVGQVMELTLHLSPEAPGRRGAALAAGLLAALTPQAVAISQYGRVDHHVLEASSMLALLRWALWREPVAGAPARPWRFELAGAAVAAYAVLSFTGAPLYVALVLPPLAARLLAAPRPALVGSGAPGLLLGAALAALGTAPLVTGHGKHLSYGFSSWLQPLLVAAGAAGLALLAAARQLPRRRVALLAGGALLAAAAAAVALPGLTREVWRGVTEFLLRRDPWLSTIDEFQPIRGWRAAWRFWGLTGVVAPLFLVLPAIAASPDRRRQAWSLAWVGLLLTALTWSQNRFGRVQVGVHAVAVGLTLGLLAKRLAGWRPRLASALPVAAGLALALLDPRLRATLARDADHEDSAIAEAALAMRAMPTTAGDPAPGVFTAWDMGNEILLLAGRPVVANGMGPFAAPRGYHESEAALALSERPLLEWMASRRLGWALLGAATGERVPTAAGARPFRAGPDGRGVLDRAWMTEAPLSAAVIGGSGLPAMGVPHLAHLRPVWASARVVRNLAFPVPVLWLYQRVAGARLTGAAPPGSPVTLEIPFTERGRPHAWRAAARAGEDGRFELTVPLPTGEEGGAVTTGAGMLTVGDGPPHTVVIPEAAVLSGARVVVDGPAVGPAGPGERGAPGPG